MRLIFGMTARGLSSLIGYTNSICQSVMHFGAPWHTARSIETVLESLGSPIILVSVSEILKRFAV